MTTTLNCGLKVTTQSGAILRLAIGSVLNVLRVEDESIKAALFGGGFDTFDVPIECVNLKDLNIKGVDLSIDHTKKTIATVQIQALCECPKCNKHTDVFPYVKETLSYFNVLAFEDINAWAKCSNCKQSFIVNDVCY